MFFFSNLKKQTGAHSLYYIIVLISCRAIISIQAISRHHFFASNHFTIEWQKQIYLYPMLNTMDHHSSHIVTGAGMNTDSRNHFQAHLQNVFSI